MGELRISARALRKSPGYTIIAVLTLALGVGANTAIFSVVKAVLLDPLPYSRPDRLVTITERAPSDPDHPFYDYTTAEELRRGSQSCQSVSSYRDSLGILMDSGEPEVLRGLRVSWDFFDTLGVKMQLGRGFVREEDQPGRRREIILSHGLWLRRFGADPGAIGRVLRLSESQLTVVGVLPAGFQPLIKGTSELLPEMYIPLGLDPLSTCRNCQGVYSIARLKPGVGVEQAGAELETVLGRIVADHPAEHRKGARISVISLRDRLFGRAAIAFWSVFGAVGFVLLIACANVANLALARATNRAKEIALRAALGAGRRRIVRQLLTESALVALAGGTLGLALAWAGARTLASLAPAQILRAENTRLDMPVFLFDLAASLVTALLFGLAPAWRASRVDLNEVLKSEGRTAASRSHGRLRNALAMAEVALAFVLVTGAGLMANSYVRLMNVDPGYDPHNILTLSTNVAGPRYWKDKAEVLGYYQQALERLRATPGVESAAFTSIIPMDYADHAYLHIEGRPIPDETKAPLVDPASVSPDYFHVMRIPLKRGRLFTAQDNPATIRVALISASFARAQFPNEDPLGKHIKLGALSDGQPWFTVVGVVGDVRQYGLDRAPQMQVYVAETQEPAIGYYRLVARTTIDPNLMERAIRDAFRAVDSAMPVYHVKPLDRYLAGTLADRTFALALLGMFGSLALALAAAGVYGVMSYSVSLRTRELGIRMALGAERRTVVAMVMRESFALAAIGVAAGFAASLFLTRLIENLLFEVRPADAATMGCAAALLIAAALLASYIPARRAAGIDPMAALRCE